MFAFVKKTLYTGVGILFLTKEKVESVVNSLSKQVDEKQQEGKDAIKEVVKKIEQSKDAAEHLIHNQFEKVLVKLDIPTKKDIADLQRQIKDVQEIIKNQ